MSDEIIIKRSVNPASGRVDEGERDHWLDQLGPGDQRAFSMRQK